MPTSGAPSTYQYRKHSKSFTGCWTCRGRKVKCDERRPKCSQCTQKGLVCGGYDVRLQWITPETGDGSEATNPQLMPVPSSHRSRITMGPPLPALSLEKIDNIILTLDSFNPEDLTATEKDNDRSRFLKCFGVFGAADDHSSVSLLMQSTSSAQPTSNNIDVTPSPNHSSSLTENAQFSPPQDIDISLPLTTFHDNHILDGSDPYFDDISIDQVDLGWLFDTQNANSLSQDLNIQYKTNGIFGSPSWHEPFEPIPRSPPVSNGISRQERFLMYHYTSKIVNLFVVLENVKSPWQTIHIPRALQSAGELVVMGYSPPSKNALRNALLSISAFALSNEHKNQGRFEDGQKWAGVATGFRGIAIKHLKEAVQTGFFNGSRPRYKECLATMLSMISINVMSGDTETCAMHLDGAYRLINQARSWKKKYSSKAQALHRIYFFLRTVYESTRMIPATAQSSNSDSPMLDWGTSAEAISGVLPEDGPTSAGRSPSDQSTNDMCTYAHIYGVPHSLLILLNRAVEVVRMVMEEREQTRVRGLSSDLAAKCDEMELSIVEWISDPINDPASPGRVTPTNSIIMEHMTRAFHNAIIIYFAQHVRLLKHQYLQPFITKVIDSIETIERIKAEAHIFAAPLYWPVFIAASEAFEPALQERFQKWYRDVEIYGIGCIRTGTQVLSDVWDKGPCPGATLTSIWRMVLERRGDILLLS
ncbi:unnamed protein product [Clonostachys solani]|uniref:Zn(2)-C6 fungal-type domain-containing protein n=1 Tax=Clonostachys solani TaxID=160281 RepID=A0A9N9ZHM2_9HYPO|nr:unnamed protein product [Clonostachys solani]